MPSYTSLNVNDRDLSLLKPVVSADLESRTVLTNEPWDFVDLDLARQKKTDVQFYWQQARQFYTVSQGLPARSAPLLLYYAYMNAVKALLSARGLLTDAYHGVSEWVPSTASPTDPFTVGVKIKKNGILPSLSGYYGESETSNLHTLKDLLFNMPFIHRTYSLTYGSREMFVPVKQPVYVVEDGTSKVYIAIHLTRNVDLTKVRSDLPASLAVMNTPSGDLILSIASVVVSNTASPNAGDLQSLAGLARSLREDVCYINGTYTLWYIKLMVGGAARLCRQNTTLTLAAMHRLSEICRYAPMKLVQYLEGDGNWLVNEFIKMSGSQFLDELACEITGKQFLVPNIRPAE